MNYLKLSIFLLCSLFSILSYGASDGMNSKSCQEFLAQSSNLLDQISALERRTLERNLGTSNIRPLDFETYGDIKYPGLYRLKNTWRLPFVTGNQLIERSGDLENELIKRSQISSTRSKMQLTIRAKNNGELITFGDFYEGTSDSIPPEIFAQAINNFLDKYLTEERQGINYLEIIRSNLTIDAIGNNNFEIHPLGPEDMEEAKKLSEDFGVPIVIKVVVANGYAYSAAFFRGINVTFESNSGE